ncbi:hypothetical protein PsorP6_003852 [Peronosclerospora sorghi]|uniref:Uncharacterized protein n=1 Tax=Peronosclerospora sorghi TaxID=230839 RepID=A0ACC0VQ98_9STRA|nr:hypothetical protein PsorP6_003852 [Peronosclerospora sorghi]
MLYPLALCALLLPLVLLAALGLFFYTFAIPWGENQIRQALHLAPDVNIQELNASFIEANKCSGCIFGSNTQWPTDTTGTRHFLDTEAGSTASGVIATSLAGAAVISTGSMLWAPLIPSATAALSFSGGFYEMTHIVEQAQFAGMICQLQIKDAPTFLLQFSKELSWTNFNMIRGGTNQNGGKGNDDATRRLAHSDSSVTSMFAAAGESGPARYAALIGVDSDNLFFYTLVTFTVVIGVLHALFVVAVLVVGLAKNQSFGEMATKWYRKVIWAGVFALLLAQYMFAMTGSYFISSESSGESANGSSSSYALGIFALAAVIIAALGLGIIVIGNNPDEVKDVGTIGHYQRAFSNKYSAYYEEYNFDNRFFFVPRILLAVMTGAVVGIVRDATTQLLSILTITMMYMILLLFRQPNLLRFLYYLGVASVFMKVVLIFLTLIVARDDCFPQNVRDNVAYGIIGVNMFIFMLLFVRQAYTSIHKIIVACRVKKEYKETSIVDSTEINLEYGNNTSNDRHAYQQVEISPDHGGQQQQYQLQTNSVPGYSVHSTPHDHSENVPMLEPPPEPKGVFSRSKGKTRPPISRNQQYSFESSARRGDDFEMNSAIPTFTAEPVVVASVPTYDVLAAYFGTTNTEAELSPSGRTSPKGRSAGRRLTSSRGPPSSRSLASSRGPPSARDLDSSKGLGSSRGLASSRGPASSRGGVIGMGRSGSGHSVCVSTAPLDEYASSFCDASSGMSGSSSRGKHSSDPNFSKQDVDIDEMEINAERDMMADSSVSAAARRQPFSPAASTTSSIALMEHSYVNFID